MTFATMILATPLPELLLPPAAVAVAGIGPALIVLWGQRKNRKAIEAAHEEIRTNHGLPARAYLEMIADVAADVKLVRDAQERSERQLLERMGEHEEADAERFALLDDGLDELRGALERLN